MLDNIVFCFNSILPVFFVITIGYFLKKYGFFTDEFISVSDKLVFRVALPASLFYSVAGSDFTSSFDVKLTVFCVVGVLVLFAVILTVFTFAISKKDIRGAVVQGIYRSNFAILGIPLAQNLLGDEGGRVASLLVSFIIPVYNVLAVTVLALNMPSDSKQSAGKVAVRIVKNIVTNPLIIAVVLAFPFSFGLITMPTIADKTVSYIAAASTPLALLSIGGSFRFGDLKGNIGYSALAVFLKIVAVPAIFCTAAILMGFTGTELGVILIVFGTPTALSSYIMAKEMKSNSIIASQIVVLSTVLCSVTILAGSFLLKTFGLI